MKPKHQRLLLVLAGMAMLTAGATLMVKVFKENIIYFYTPSEAAKIQISPNQAIRLGGLVKSGSVKKSPPASVEFTLTDGEETLIVRYDGPLPSLFREGQGIIAEGKLERGVLTASSILAKHDENYMPKNVADKLKTSGHWHPE